jgi:cysteine/O-acetylserine efflux protein
MQIQWLALTSFVLVTTLTPGPNNISAMSLGISHGYRASLRFLAGITTGFFLIMCVCALIAAFLLGSFPFIEPYLRIGGSLYIVWLAIHTFLGSLKADPAASAPLGFRDGLLLQVLNPKVIVYGLTLYSTFLLALSGRVGLIVVSACAFAAVGYGAISLWAVAGTSFARLFKKPLVRKLSSAVLSLVLLYSAGETSGLFAWLMHR